MTNTTKVKIIRIKFVDFLDYMGKHNLVADGKIWWENGELFRAKGSELPTSARLPVG